MHLNPAPAPLPPPAPPQISLPTSISPLQPHTRHTLLLHPWLLPWRLFVLPARPLGEGPFLANHQINPRPEPTTATRASYCKYSRCFEPFSLRATLTVSVERLRNPATHSNKEGRINSTDGCFAFSLAWLHRATLCQPRNTSNKPPSSCTQQSQRQDLRKRDFYSKINKRTFSNVDL